MPKEIFALFEEEYLHVHKPYNLKSYKIYEENDVENETVVHFEGNLRFEHTDHMISGVGNGPIDAFFKPLELQIINLYLTVSMLFQKVQTQKPFLIFSWNVPTVTLFSVLVWTAISAWLPLRVLFALSIVHKNKTERYHFI